MDFPKAIDGDPVLLVALTAEKHWPNSYVTPEDGIDMILPVNRFVIVQSQGIDNDPIYRVYCLDDDNKIVTGDFYYTLESAQSFLALEYGLRDVQWETV